MRVPRPAAAAALFALAAALRFYALPDLSRGFYQDEAITGLQAADLLHGTRMAEPYAPRMMFPLWTALVAPVVSFFGMTPLAVRLPAALAGLAAIVSAFFAGRRFAGFLGGISAAGFLSFSLWHLIYSRSGTSPVLVPLQGLLLAIAVTGRPADYRRDGFISGLLASSGFLTYFAGWSLVPTLVLAIAVRSWGDRGFRPRAAGFARWAAAGLAPVLVALALNPSGFLLGAGMVHPALGSEAAGMTRYFAALFLPGRPEFNPGYWAVYPPGAALLAPLESAAVLLGLAALLTPGTPRWLAVLAVSWVVAGLLPVAALRQDLRFSRAIGVLAPLVLLAALAAGRLRALVPRLAPWIVAAVLLVQAAFNGWRYFGGYCRDQRVRVWANGVETDAALYIKQKAVDLQVVLVNSKSSLAVLDFFLYDEIAKGRVVFERTRGGAVFETVIRDTVLHQPVLFLFHCPALEGPGKSALLILNQEGMLAEATRAEVDRRWASAAVHYQERLGMFPDFALAHLRLARVLERLGDRRGAAAEREVAQKLGFRAE